MSLRDAKGKPKHDGPDAKGYLAHPEMTGWQSSFQCVRNVLRMGIK